MRQVRNLAGGLMLALLCACATPIEGRIGFASLGDQDTDILIANADGSDPTPFLPSPALDYNASWSPDGKWILFTSERGGSADIWRARPDGTGLSRLTDNPAFDDQAALSPDGRSLAFVSTRTGQADIWLLDIKSGALRNLTNSPDGEFRPAWSPDGQWIAFSSDRDSLKPHFAFSAAHSTEVYVMRGDGSSVRRLTNKNEIVGSPSWSPDGTRLAVYAATLPEAQAITAPRRIGGTSQIATIDVATGAFRIVTSGPGEKWSPRFLSDGRIGYAMGGDQPGLAIVDGPLVAIGPARAPSWSSASGRIVFHREMHPQWDPPFTNARSLDKRYALVRTGVMPSWSPDGRQILVNSGTAAIVRNDILKLNADGSGAVTLLAGEGERSALAPVWSPRGGQIAFALGRFFPGVGGQPANSTAQIATMDVSGKSLQLLTPEGENAGFPSWSPDERYLVYRVSAAGRSTLRILDLETRSVRQLTSGPANDNSPAWSPSGDLIVFTSKRGAEKDYDLYLIHPDGTGLKRLTFGPGNQSHPAWSSDGKWIVFTSAGPFKDEAALHPFNAQPNGEIHVIRPDGSDRRILTDNQFEDGTPTWIPAPR